MGKANVGLDTNSFRVSLELKHCKKSVNPKRPSVNPKGVSVGWTGAEWKIETIFKGSIPKTINYEIEKLTFCRNPCPGSDFLRKR